MHELHVVFCSKELTKANASVAAKDAEAEEKNTTIVQVWRSLPVLWHCSLVSI